MLEEPCKVGGHLNFFASRRFKPGLPPIAAPTRHHVLAPVADIIAASDDPMIDHCTSRMSSTLKGLNQVGKIRIQPLMTRRGERKRASLKACLVYLTAVSKKYFWVLRSKGTRLTI